MSFNPNHIRALRNAKNAQAQIAAPRAAQAPFFELRQFLDGAHKFRIWPADPVKNPFGYLHLITHKCWKQMDSNGKMSDCFEFQCPRSTNWDPLPARYEQELGANGQPVMQVVYDAHTGQPALDPATGRPIQHPVTYPVYNERCYACELKQGLLDAGIESAEDIRDTRLQLWLFGHGYIGPQDFGVQGLFPTKEAGGDKWLYPVSFYAAVDSVIPSATGGKDKIFYRPSSELIHGLLSLQEGRIQEELDRLIEEVPDCSHVMAGRWFRFDKKGGGKGAGGYQITIDPNPSPFGVDVSTLQYPNFSTWLAPNPKYGKVGKRFTYAEQEAVCANPNSWWVTKLEALGVVVRD